MNCCKKWMEKATKKVEEESEVGRNLKRNKCD